MAYTRFREKTKKDRGSEWYIYYDGGKSSHSPKRKETQVVTVMVSDNWSGTIDGKPYNIEKSFSYKDLSRIEKRSYRSELSSREVLEKFGEKNIDGIEICIRDIMDSIGCGIDIEEMIIDKEGKWKKIGLNVEAEAIVLRECFERFIEDVEEMFEEKKKEGKRKGRRK